MKGIYAALCAVAGLAIFAGCGGGSKALPERTVSESDWQVFRYPIITNPTSFDPGIVQDGDTLDMIQQVWEGLVTWDENNMPVGNLAESWDIEDGGTTYIFHLKKGVKFHNGREVTADDFKWSIERNCDPALASQTADAYLSDIVGVTDRVEGRAQEISGYQVVDPYTIKIQLKQPTPYFVGKLTYLVSAVMPKEAVPMGKEITEVEQMIGTGPFKMQDYVTNQKITLAAFDDYHGGRPELDRVERIVIKDAQTRLNKFRSGELDMTMLQRQDITGVEGDPALKDSLKLFERPAVWYVGMNQLAYEPFKDKRVRQAFAMAIDKKTIVETLMGGINTTATGIVPKGVVGHRPDAKDLDFNPERARELLAEAGYEGGQGLPPLEMYFREKFPDIKLVAEAVAGMLKEHLGVEVKLQTKEWRAYLELYNDEKLPFYHMRWAADYLDPQNFLSHMLATYGPENKCGYNNPEFDRLCRQADTLLDLDQRLPLYAQAEDIALDDAVWVPIYYQRDAELHRPELAGVRESLFGHLPHTTVRMEQPAGK